MVLPCGATALHLAACDGEEEVVTWGLQQGCNPDQLDQEGLSPLMLAAGVEEAEDGHVTSVMALIDGKANLDLQDQEGCTALHHAARAQNAAAFEAIRDAGANMEIANAKGRTPKMLEKSCVIC